MYGYIDIEQRPADAGWRGWDAGQQGAGKGTLGGSISGKEPENLLRFVRHTLSRPAASCRFKPAADYRKPANPLIRQWAFIFSAANVKLFSQT